MTGREEGGGKNGFGSEKEESLAGSAAAVPHYPFGRTCPTLIS